LALEYSVLYVLAIIWYASFCCTQFMLRIFKVVEAIENSGADILCARTENANVRLAQFVGYDKSKLLNAN